jgi:hypothetical protein
MESLCSLENVNETRKKVSLISVLYSCAYGTRIESAGYCVLPISNRLKCVGYEPNDETLNFPYHAEENKEKTFVFQYSASKILQNEFIAGYNFRKDHIFFIPAGRRLTH